ncbi:MAG: extracellular solute-binding protein [Ruminococcaceae bacterium]|nr:extracellular solute-binding protein [Oscillospiraceae bacterium]
MSKRLICMLLALVMLFALTAGCGSKEAEPVESEVVEEAPAEEAEAPAETPEEAPAEETEVEEPAEPEGYVPLEPLSYPLCDEVTTLTYWQAWPPFLSTFCSPTECETFAKLEEITGVHLDITVVDTETQSEKFNLMVAAGDMTDIMQGANKVYTGGITQAIAEEVVIDIWPYVEECMPSFRNAIGDDENIRRYMLDDEGQLGNIYGLYSDYFYQDQGFWCRQDFLDKIGMDMPVTLEEYDAVLEAFKTELELEQPIVLLAASPRLEFLATAYESGTVMENGDLVDYSITENAKNYFLKMNEWYEKGYIYHDFLSNDYSQTKPPEACVYQDLAGMYNEDVVSISTYRKNHSNPDFELRAMPQMLLEEGQVLDTCKIPSKVSDKYALSISTNCEEENIPLALGMIDYLFTEEGRILGNFGIEGTTFEYQEDGTPMFTDFIMNHKLGYQGAQSAFINPGLPGLVDLSVNQLTYDEAQKEAVDIWISTFNSYDKTVPNYSLSPEESTEVATLQTDIETYQEEMALKFIMGEVDIEATWDEYVNTIMELGYEEIMTIRQGALDRYLAK